MIFNRLFRQRFGYLHLRSLASRRGGEALIIDPVIEKVDQYLRLIHELDLKPWAVDTHHADHITGLGALRDRTVHHRHGRADQGGRCLDAACRGRNSPSKASRSTYSRGATRMIPTATSWATGCSPASRC